MPIRRSPNGAGYLRPQAGRDRPEWVVAINRNAWSQSIGIAGRDHPVCADAYRVAAFRRGLTEAGLFEGQNCTIEFHWADGHNDRLRALASDLVHREVAVIVASSLPAAFAAKAATTTLPIIFETGADPVKLGLVESLDRPGGNVTGVTQSNDDVESKRLQLLHEVLPNARIIALLVNPTDGTLAESQVREVRSAAEALGVKLTVLNASAERDFEPVFAGLTESQAGGLVIAGDAFFSSHSKQLATLSVQHSLPAIYQWREFAAAGGLMSYGANITDTHRLVGIYVGRILKGDKPGNLPVPKPVACRPSLKAAT